MQETTLERYDYPHHSQSATMIILIIIGNDRENDHCPLLRTLRTLKVENCNINLQLTDWHALLLMEEIRANELIGSLSLYLQGFVHPRCCRISSINSRMVFDLLSKKGSPKAHQGSKQKHQVASLCLILPTFVTVTTLYTWNPLMTLALTGKDLVLEGPRLKNRGKQVPDICIIMYIYIYICVYTFAYMPTFSMWLVYRPGQHWVGLRVQILLGHTIHWMKTHTSTLLFQHILPAWNFR